MVSWMKHSHLCTKNCIYNHPVASSISFDEKDFNPLNYRRGLIWMNINWRIYTGLQQHHLISEAKKLRKAIIDLVNENGFYEYYNHLTDDGLGTNNFSWAAALLIDLILDKTIKRFGENL